MTRTAAGSRLVVNEAEAEQVREIFVIFLRHRSLIATLEEIHKRGWRMKSWTTRKGEHHAGQPFDRHSAGAAADERALLGEVKYKGKVYPGEQAAIVDRWFGGESRIGYRATTRSRNQGRGTGRGGTIEGFTGLRWLRQGDGGRVHDQERPPVSLLYLR